MAVDRRWFIRSAGVMSALPLVARAQPPSDAPAGPDYTDLIQQVLGMFHPMPGVKSLLIWAPETSDEPELKINLDPARRMFVGSAFKAYVLCERLRQLDGPDIGKRLQENLLPLDADVWSPSSPVFDPPHLSGRVPERTAAEAMISHSDNTGTDIVMRATGPEKIRQFISEAGLSSTQIPDSTRAFFGYLLGRPDFRSITWEQLVQALQDNTSFVNPPLNDTQTLASSAVDLVDFYSRSLKGEFFTDPATLKEYRRILSYADAVSAAVPVGASGYGKGGSIDVRGFHTMCFAGGMAFSDRWVYFANILNWDAPDAEDPQTVAAWVASTERAMNLVYQAQS